MALRIKVNEEEAQYESTAGRTGFSIGASNVLKVQPTSFVTNTGIGRVSEIESRYVTESAPDVPKEAIIETALYDSVTLVLPNDEPPVTYSSFSSKGLQPKDSVYEYDDVDDIGANRGQSPTLYSDPQRFIGGDSNNDNDEPAYSEPRLASDTTHYEPPPLAPKKTIHVLNESGYMVLAAPLPQPMRGQPTTNQSTTTLNASSAPQPTHPTSSKSSKTTLGSTSTDDYVNLGPLKPGFSVGHMQSFIDNNNNDPLSSAPLLPPKVGKTNVISPNSETISAQAPTLPPKSKIHTNTNLQHQPHNNNHNGDKPHSIAALLAEDPNFNDSVGDLDLNPSVHAHPHGDVTIARSVSGYKKFAVPTSASFRKQSLQPTEEPYAKMQHGRGSPSSQTTTPANTPVYAQVIAKSQR
eukprot:m.175193 g.175193  ORF g.175193 m.175193 type:complete len:409 (+) comp31804_c0_seq1:28-1254(+)